MSFGGTTYSSVAPIAYCVGVGAVRLASWGAEQVAKGATNVKGDVAAPVPLPLVLCVAFVCTIFLLGAQSCERHDGVDCFLIVGGERLGLTFEPLARVRCMYLRVDAGSKSTEFSAPLRCSCVCVCVCVCVNAVRTVAL